MKETEVLKFIPFKLKKKLHYMGLNVTKIMKKKLCAAYLYCCFVLL